MSSVVRPTGVVRNYTDRRIASAVAIPPPAEVSLPFARSPSIASVREEPLPPSGGGLAGEDSPGPAGRVGIFARYQGATYSALQDPTPPGGEGFAHGVGIFCGGKEIIARGVVRKAQRSKRVEIVTRGCHMSRGGRDFHESVKV